MKPSSQLQLVVLRQPKQLLSHGVGVRPAKEAQNLSVFRVPLQIAPFWSVLDKQAELLLHLGALDGLVLPGGQEVREDVLDRHGPPAVAAEEAPEAVEKARKLAQVPVKLPGLEVGRAEELGVFLVRPLHHVEGAVRDELVGLEEGLDR